MNAAVTLLAPLAILALLAAQGSAAAQPPEGTDASGVIWTWQDFRDPGGTGDVIVPNPDDYRLWLAEDGTFRFRADCDSGTGSYVAEGSAATFHPPTAATLAGCRPGSLHRRYLQLLGEVRTFERRGDDLLLHLAADGGTMAFAKLHAVTGVVVAPDGAVLPHPAVIEIRVEDVSLADAPAKQVGGQIILDARRFPVAFEAPYNARAIAEDRAYGIRATVQDGLGELRFINNSAVNVLTRGSPTYDIEVRLDPVD